MSRALVWLPLLLLGCPKDPETGDVDTGDTAPLQGWPELPELDATIEEAVDAASIPGLAAAIVAGGDVAWVGTYGLADLEAERPVSEDTAFMLASVSKVVTAVALMQAVQDGLVDLDASVDTMLPFVVDNPHTKGEFVTPRHLATHTSAIIDNWNALGSEYAVGDSTVALGDFLAGYLVEGGDWYNADRNYADREPGDRYEYSNVGASLAGYLVESTSGTAFDDHCDDRIFAVLGMEHTGWHLADHDLDELAVPYVMRGGELQAEEHYGYPDYPDGQLRASVVDLARFVAAVSAGGAWGEARILDEDSNAAMLEEQPYGGGGQGVIWYEFEIGGRSVWGHNGGDTGVATEIAFDPATGVGVLVFVNTDWNNPVTTAFETVQGALFEAGEGL